VIKRWQAIAGTAMLWHRCYHDAMERTTIVLPDELRRRLKQIAAERDVSMATVIREALEEKANQTRPKPKSIGVGDSGRTDLSMVAGEIRPVPRSWR
jgi:hypothetical protein